MSSCTSTRAHTPCSGKATHFCVAEFEAPHVWRVEATPWQIETLDGYKLTHDRLDANGERIFDAEGRPVRDPAMHTQEFCATAAALVCAERNATASRAHTGV